MSFLPQNYEAPQGAYMKLLPGKNKIRPLCSAIVGNEFWTTDGSTRKPVRRRVNERIDTGELSIDSRSGEREKIKHFWAFAVWNYSTSAVQILEVTQAGIRDSIQALCADEDWGDPLGYDISIGKTGTGLDTAYSVLPSNKSPTPAHILQQYRALKIDLEKLFDGGDPFGAATAAAPVEPAKTIPPSATEAARKQAYLTLRDTMPDASAEAQKNAWLNLLKQRFPNRTQASVIAIEWQGLVDHLRASLQEPEVPVITDDEIPF